MNAGLLKGYLPWSLRGISPLLNKYGDAVLFSAVKRTPPMACNPESDTGMHSAVPHRYVMAYLTAIKSFLRYCADVAVFVHDDGSLRDEDKQLIRDQVPGVQIIDRAWADQEFAARVADEFLMKVRTSYTSYLKLFDPTLISDKRRIVIVDTDVLFLRRPSAVIEWIQQGGTPWYHKSEPWRKRSDADQKAEPAPAAPKPEEPKHIQWLVVKRLAEINRHLGTQFAFEPGFNSGFIGYEQGTVDYAELKRLLVHLHETLGDKIFRWGAEQTMHGLVLCGKGATPLPSEDYMVYTNLNSSRAEQAAFVHFIGEFRYYRLKYPRLAAKIIKELKATD